MTTVLLVENNKNLRLLYEQELSLEGYKVITAVDGKAALEKVQEQHPDIVIMDINLPLMEGIEAMGHILYKDKGIPIIIKTAYSNYKNNFMSWDADEYLVKPVSREVFLARVASLLRRVQRNEQETRTAYIDPVVMINFATREVRIRGQETHLRPLEFRLLVTLVQNADRILTFEEILDRVWGAGAGSLAPGCRCGSAAPKRAYR